METTPDVVGVVFIALFVDNSLPLVEARLGRATYEQSDAPVLLLHTLSLHVPQMIRCRRQIPQRMTIQQKVWGVEESLKYLEMCSLISVVGEVVLSTGSRPIVWKTGNDPTHLR